MSLPTHRDPGAAAGSSERPPASSDSTSEKALRAEINRRYAVQLHMVLILAVCFGVGLVVTKLLLMAGISAMWARYSVALLAAYAAFLAGIRLWLAYAGYAALPDARAGNLVSNASGQGSSGWRSPDLGRNDGGSSAHFRGGGGSYGGGGASASFASSEGGPEPAVSAPLVSTTLSSTDPPVDGNNGHWGGGGHIGSFGGGGSRDLGVLVVLIGVIALIAGIFGGVIYLVYMAPKILGDAAFAALLSAGLVRSTRRIRAGGWVGSAVSDTWPAFAAVFALALAFALIAQHFYPDALTFFDVLGRLRS